MILMPSGKNIVPSIVCLKYLLSYNEVRYISATYTRLAALGELK